LHAGHGGNSSLSASRLIECPQLVQVYTPAPGLSPAEGMSTSPILLSLAYGIGVCCCFDKRHEYKLKAVCFSERGVVEVPGQDGLARLFLLASRAISDEFPS
jgi:hypothetical protein